MLPIIIKKRSLDTMIGFAIGTVFLVVNFLTGAFANDQVMLQSIDIEALSGGRTSIQLSFDGTPPAPRSYTIDKPARITFDFLDITNGLNKKYYNLGDNNARNVTVLEAGGRTRLVVGLTNMVNYSTRTEGSSLYIMLGTGGTGFAQNSVKNLDKSDTSGLKASVESSGTSVSPVSVGSDLHRITGINFRRGKLGEGRIEIDFSSKGVEVDIFQTGTDITLKFPEASLPERLQRRLDVIDFATPVHFVDALPHSNGSHVIIRAFGAYDYSAYQTDNQLVLELKPVSKDDPSNLRKKKFLYNGEKLSLNFQDIEVRSVLQLIADFTDLNLVASDTVQGHITLRLQNVPWDQALDLILSTKGLGKRTIGNILMVAPADEIANRERLELENSRQVEAMAPVQTEFMQVNYAKAIDISKLISSEQGLLSARGSVSVDNRTNTLLIRDTATKIDDIRGALSHWDVPVRQVQIEARVVIASARFERDLGVRWTVGNNLNPNGGKGITGNGAIGGADNIAVDLGVAAATSALNIGFINGDDMLGLTLQALESEGLSETISQPKIVTADGQTARIESGVEIPYQEASSSGATTVTFKNAVLSLEVTPQITPNDRIVMDLKVNQDSIGQVFLGIPSIDTRQIETQVLVNNGETIVLGGIYRRETVETVSKTPILGDIPYIGNLFKRTSKQDAKTELLIFITPKLIKETVPVR